MDFKNAYGELKSIIDELAYIRSINLLMMWDMWTGMPKQGMEYRQKLDGFMAGRTSDILNSEKAKELAESLKDMPIDDLTDIEKAMVRKFLHQYKYAVNVPKEMAIEFAELTGKSQAAWVQAKRENDYSIFKPLLKQVFETKVKITKLIDPNKDPFEVMVDESDMGICLDELNKEFDKIKRELPKLIEKIKKSGVSVDDSILLEKFDEKTLGELVNECVVKIGYNFENGDSGEALHPFTAMIGPKDARITLNLSNYKLGLYGGLHEAGHAMYGYRSNDEAINANMWGGAAGGFHEGQSRFYENIIGKSKAFSKVIFNIAKEKFEQFRDVELEEYYKAVNKVETSLNRISADEVTYSLHPIIRFELEQKLISGEVDFDDLPKAWADMYESYLGVRPETDGDGVLQDIHWSVGMFGYFQSYTLGNIYGGQIRNELKKAIPDFEEQIAQGKMDAVNDWLTENIHQYGDVYTGSEMIKKLTGESLNADYFIEYLYEKYSVIYGI